MTKITHGVVDPRTGKFHPVSTPNPTRTGRFSLGNGNDGHLNTAISTAQALALQSGRRTQVASKITADDNSETIVVHGKVKNVLKGSNGNNQLSRSTSNKNI